MTTTALAPRPAERAAVSATVDLWSAPLDMPGQRLLTLAKGLSANERARASRFVRNRDARRFVAGRGVVREILSSYFDCAPGDVPLTYSPDGKPQLATRDALEFSVTHSAARLVVAVSADAELGVDVERVRDGLWSPRLAYAIFTDEELAQFGPGTLDDEQLFRLWTRKEAYLKGTGRGLRTPAREVAVTPEPDLERFVPRDLDGRALGDWTIGEFCPAAGYVASVAVASGAWRARPRRWMGAWWYPSFAIGDVSYWEGED